MAEKKSLIEVILMPLVVALVGIIGTILITNQQQDNSKALSDAQMESTEKRSNADRQIRVLEMFVEKITSSSERDRILALKILEELDPGLAAKLASAVSFTETSGSEVGKVAITVAQDAAVRAKKARVFIHIALEEQRSMARSVARRLGSEGFVVPGIERVSNPPDNDQLRFFWPADKDLAGDIERILKSIDVHVQPMLIEGFEKTARQEDYEIWFAN